MSEQGKKTVRFSRIQVQLSAGPGTWKDLRQKRTEGKLIDGRDAEVLILATMDEATDTGLPAAIFRADLPDGRTILFQTTVANLLAALRLLEDKHGQEVRAALAAKKAAQQGEG